MAETAVAAVLSKFGELATNEAKVLLDVGDEMMLLRDRLEWLQAFIRDADRKRRTGTDQLTRVWVRQTRDVAFQAEDALDEFFYQVDLQSQGHRCWKMWRKYLTCFYIQIVIRHRLSARIKRINRRLEKISENQKEYKIEHIPLTPMTSSTTATSAWRDDAVGFDDDVAALKQMLLREDHPRQMFISILGESGVGKITLVNMILENDMDVTRLFDVMAWYFVPPDSTMDDLLQEIYNRIVESCTKKENEDFHLPEQDHIANKIHRLLAKKKYLVILGGISSKTMLNCVRASLPDDNTGSRVMLILDTENEEVAWHASTMNMQGISGIHLLSPLDEERSGKLFCSRVIRKKQSENENMSKYNKIVYDITGGYPLAIVVLAGLLRFKEKPGQWEVVLQQLRSESGMEKAQGGEGSKRPGAILFQEKRIEFEWQMPHAIQANLSIRRTIERVFWASFEDLPNDLKSCFLYFVAFPKNTSLIANHLVRMWMAEGFIKPQKGKTLEELGHNYLKELVLRCLIQIVDMDDANDTRSIKVIVHRSLYGFLQSETREAGFIEAHDMHDVFVPPSVRRLSFISFDGYTTFPNKFCKLRSFICWVKEEDWSNDSTCEKKRWHDLKFLRGSKFLRVFHISGLRLKDFPSEICDMIHLRYLRVNCKDLKQLPSCIKRLLNLQTLDIRGTQVEKIDPCFWKINVLRHVLAEKLMLPASIEEELGELQTLVGVKPTQGQKWDQSNCPLHKMTKLRTLVLDGFEDDKHGAAMESALRKMHLLVKLELQGDVIPSCVFTAQSLQYLELVKLEGTVQWPSVDAFNVHMVRPNLVNLSLTDANDAPEDIREELRKVGFNRSASPPVYQLSYKQGEGVAAKPEHQGEARYNKTEQEHQGEEAEAKLEHQGKASSSKTERQRPGEEAEAKLEDQGEASYRKTEQ